MVTDQQVRRLLMLNEKEKSKEVAVSGVRSLRAVAQIEIEYNNI